MTREEKIKILTDAQERAYKQIDLTEGWEMGTEEFHRLLTAAQNMEWMVLPDSEARATDVKIIDSTVPDEVRITPAEPEIVPEQVQPETGVDEPKYSMTDVRAALAKARGNGVNVAEIIRSFGVDSFPAIPESEYPAVMAKLGAV